MTAFSIIHALLGLSTLGLGAAIFALRKGEQRHRALGWVYAALMSASLAAILIDDWGRWRPFHGYAAFILCGVAIALVAVRGRARLGPSWRAWHASLMSFSALAALIATLGVVEGLIIGPQETAAFYVAFNATIAGCTVGGLWLINTRAVIWGRNAAMSLRTARSAFSVLAAIASTALIWAQWTVFVA